MKYLPLISYIGILTIPLTLNLHTASFLLSAAFSTAVCLMMTEMLNWPKRDGDFFFGFIMALLFIGVMYIFTPMEDPSSNWIIWGIACATPTAFVIYAECKTPSMEVNTEE